MEQELLQIQEVPRRLRGIRRAVGIGVVLERSVKGGGDDEEPDRPEHRGDELDDQKVRPDHRGVLDALVHTDDGVLPYKREQSEPLLLSRKRLRTAGCCHPSPTSGKGGEGRAAQNESWSQGRRYPVYESRIVKKKSSVPMTQLNSRGGLYEPV